MNLCQRDQTLSENGGENLLFIALVGPTAIWGRKNIYIEKLLQFLLDDVT